jgi:stress-induced morphogen
MWTLYILETKEEAQVILINAAAADNLSNLLKERLNATHVEVTDESGGCGAMFSVFVVSPKFDGLKLLDRQRLVNETIKEEMKGIHALSFKRCWTPDQYEQNKNNK